MPDPKEWTLMFYMASDNPLAISIVSQLKALKAAGYHKDVNVIAQFDPFTEGTPTHVFEVNLVNKLKYPGESNIGFTERDDDSLVPALIEDKLWRDETNRNGDQLIRDAVKKVFEQNNAPKVYHAPMAPELNGTPPRYGVRKQEQDAYTSLRRFVNFCAEKYPANHYMLFMIGHGVVVGNDVFMYDEHAETKSLTLGALGDILREFKEKIEEQRIEEQDPKPSFDLISFHSCSVSSIEVAYELDDTANYMLASQGPTFVGSWPYRQILMRIFKDVGQTGKTKDIDKLIKDIYSFCLHNTSDFLLAGYSHQVTLCDLRTIAELNESMEYLSEALKTALTKGKADSASKFVILFAHWRAQSFYKEMYTDLYDFCQCVLERCERIKQAPNGTLSDPLKQIADACESVMTQLGKSPTPSTSGAEQTLPPKPIGLQADFAGPGYQYSNGLSIYFPWNEPSEDSQILQQYKEYKFCEKFETSWLDFLKLYFDETRRSSRKTEQRQRNPLVKPLGDPTLEAEELQEDIASLIYSGEGPLGSYALKGDPEDKQGGDCDCISFKNYARDTRARGDRRKQAQKMPARQTLLGRFEGFK